MTGVNTVRHTSNCGAPNGFRVAYNARTTIIIIIFERRLEYNGEDAFWRIKLSNWNLIAKIRSLPRVVRHGPALCVQRVSGVRTTTTTRQNVFPETAKCSNASYFRFLRFQFITKKNCQLIPYSRYPFHGHQRRIRPGWLMLALLATLAFLTRWVLRL